MANISILLPTYNGSKYIEKAIKSVLQQSYKDWELIILDDASTDSTEAISIKYVGLDPRIKYIKNETNLRLAQNLNKGIKLSSGIFIARIDEDDIWIDRNKLSKQIDFLNKNPKCVLVGTGFEIIDESGKKNIRHVVSPTEDTLLRKIILRHNPFCHSSVLFRKLDVVKIGGYDQQVTYGEDWDLWLRLGVMGTLATLSDIMVRYLQRKTSMSHKHTIFRQFQFHLKLIFKNRKNYTGPYREVLILSLRTVKSLILKIK